LSVLVTSCGIFIGGLGFLLILCGQERNGGKLGGDLNSTDGDSFEYAVGSKGRDYLAFFVDNNTQYLLTSSSDLIFEFFLELPCKAPLFRHLTQYWFSARFNSFLNQVEDTLFPQT